MKRKKVPVNKKKNPKFRFMAMSKLIGIVAFLFVFIVTVYAMYEMHITQTYDALPQLIISAYAFASVYSGFYLVMAKMEHLEEEITKRQKELALLKRRDNSQEDIDAKKQEIENIKQKMMDVINEPIQPII